MTAESTIGYCLFGKMKPMEKKKEREKTNNNNNNNNKNYQLAEKQTLVQEKKNNHNIYMGFSYEWPFANHNNVNIEF